MSASDDIRQHHSGGRTSPAGGDPRALAEALKRESASELANMFDGFLDTIEEQVRLAWLANTGSRARQHDRDSVAEIRQRSDRFLETYRRRIEQNFERWLQAKPSLGVDARSMSLMSESQLQMQLLAQAVGDDLMGQVGAALASLEGRMGNLSVALGASELVHSPLQPSAIVHAFVTSFRSDDLSVDLRTMVFHHYERRLVPALSFLYARFNSRLADAGYEPVVRDPKREAAFGASPVERMQQGMASGWVPDGGVVECERPTPLRVASAQVDEARSGAATQAGNRAGHAPAPGNAAEGTPLRYRDIVRGQLRQWRAATGHAANDGAQTDAGVQGHVLGVEEMRGVVSLLQGDDPGVFARVLAGEDDRPLGLAIRDTVANGARQLGLATGKPHYAEDEEDAIDLVAMLFQSLFQTNTFQTNAFQASALQAGTQSQWVHALYGRLVMPYLKVALVDDSLFNRRGHPARRLLDALTDVCEGAHDRETADVADGVIARLVAGFREDLAVFELATDELRQFQEQQRRRAELLERRAAEAIHGRERLHYAREASGVLVSSYLARDPLTLATADFLRAQWRHALEQAWLRDGTDSQRWRELTALGDAIVALDADAALDGHGNVASRWLVLQPQIASCCSNGGLDTPASDEVQARMIFALAHPDTPREPHALAKQEAAVEGGATGLHLVGGSDTVVCDATIAARMRRLRVGQNLCLVDADGRATQARLAWISPLTSRMLIVDRRGMRKLVVSPEQLAVLVGEGQVAIRTVEAPFDQAMKQVWNQLNAATAPALLAASA